MDVPAVGAVADREPIGQEQDTAGEDAAVAAVATTPPEDLRPIGSTLNIVA